MLEKRWAYATVVFIVLALAGLGSAQEVEPAALSEYRLSFDDLAPGTLPQNWSVDATDPSGKLAEWKVIVDGQAPSKPNVLSLTRTHDTSGGVFNLCRTNAILFQDGSIEVGLRADTGKEDQGGGVIWRARDANNYYIARYNPLEDNFRIYYVKNGSRKQLASAAPIGIPAGEWLKFKIVQHGDKMEGYLNGKKYLEVSDNTFTGPGGVGFWTKADAASSFDDLRVLPASRD